MKTLTKNSILLAFLFVVSGCNFSSAGIKDIQMCTRISDNQCIEDDPVFSAETDEIFISCQLKNAPENTDVEFAWFYYGQQKVDIDAFILNSGSSIGTMELQASLTRPYNGWPLGDYEVQIKILDTDKDPKIKKFRIQ